MRKKIWNHDVPTNPDFLFSVLNLCRWKTPLKNILNMTHLEFLNLFHNFYLQNESRGSRRLVLYSHDTKILDIVGDQQTLSLVKFA